MAQTRNRIVLFSLILTIAGLMMSAFPFVDTISAEPKKAYGSISSRVRSQTELCETLGGGELHVSYSYENGKMVGASTSCKGGKNDGYNCTNTATTTDCWQAPKSRTVQPPTYVDDLPEITVIEGDIGTDIGSVVQPADGSVLENPEVVAEPIEPSVEQRVWPMPVLLPLD